MLEKEDAGKDGQTKANRGGKTNPAKVYNDERERHESLLQGWGGRKGDKARGGAERQSDFGLT